MQTQAAFGRLDGRLQGVNSTIRSTGRASRTAAGGVNQLNTAVRSLVRGFVLLQGARFVFGRTAEIESQTRSLQVLTGELGKAKEIITDLQQFASVTPFTSSELIETSKRLKAFGVETESLIDITKRLADVSGATGAELAGVATAYGQIQAKGRLQGEELLQLQERGIDIAGELKKQLGLTGEEFQSQMQKGKISSQDVERALISLTNTGGKYANGAISQSDTLSGKLSTLQDGIDNLARRLGQVLTPALKAVFNQAIAVVDAVNRALAAGRGGGFTRSVGISRNLLNAGATSEATDKIAKGISQVTAQANKVGIEQNLQALQKYQRLLQSIGPNDPNASRAVQLQGTILTKIDANLEALKKLEKQGENTQKVFANPVIPDPTNPDSSSGGTSASDAAKEQLKTYSALTREFSRQVQLRRASSDLERQLLQIGFDREDRALQISELKSAEQQASARLLSDDIARLDTAKAQVDAYYAQADAAAALSANLKGFDGNSNVNPFADGLNLAGGEDQRLVDMQQNLENLLDPMNQVIYAANTMGNAFGQAFEQIAEGTNSTQQIFADFLRGISQSLMQYASQMIAQYIALGIARMFAGLGGGTGGIPGADGFGQAASGLNLGSSGFGFDSILGRATGGPVSGNTPYIVGERGPELFVPGSSGTIVPNHELGGGGDVSVVQNFYLDGGGNTTTSGGGMNKEQAAQLARMVEASTVGVIQRERRPGGLLAR
jgi:tape measure domain-containing protein